MIAIQTITLNLNGSWTFTWYNTGASFYRVVLYGVQLAQVTSTSYTYYVQSKTAFPPPLEIVSGNELALSEMYQPYLVMQWYGISSCSYYEVQQYITGNWQTIQRVQETGQWIYTFQTKTLTDGSTYNYRVYAVDSVGNESADLYFLRYVVCPPSPADGNISISYNKPNLVVSAI